MDCNLYIYIYILHNCLFFKVVKSKEMSEYKVEQSVETLHEYI